MTARLMNGSGLGRLIAVLRGRGLRVLGPVVRDGAIVYGEVRDLGDLPTGWGDDQEAGRYRLRRRDDRARFGYAVGPDSWKRVQLPADVRLWRARLAADGGLTDFDDDAPPADRLALLGVRSCELHAMGIMDRVLGGGPDEERPFIIAVNCAVAAATCFCASMGTGPGVDRGHDLVLTELLDGPEPRYVVDIGSERGRDVLDDVPTTPADPADTVAAEAVVAATAASQTRELETDGLHDLLLSNLEHPRWDDVAERCLTCGNCTMVCPTCFCTSVEDVTDLDGSVERHRRWDSCFAVDHAYVHGGSVRASPRSRYRQWMTHKLATWVDQFGTSGCVGCGRCVTWCPVGIDITEEVRAIRGGDDDA